MTLLPALDALCEAGELEPLDVERASMAMRLDPERGHGVALAIAALGQAVAHGDTCLHLPTLAGKPWRLHDGTRHDTLIFPDAWSWVLQLHESPWTHTESGPLVLDDSGNLYFERHFRAERMVAHALAMRACKVFPLATPAALSRAQQLTPEQHHAVEAVCTRDMVVVAGGPGTGKTTTVAHMMTAWVANAFAQGGQAPRIVLLAPTGKAAARLQDAFARELNTLACSPQVRAVLPEDAQTIHRFLAPATEVVHPVGMVTPEDADAVIVDESSMVDLETLAALVARVPTSCKLVLVGDPNQLASVDAGSVLADICACDVPAIAACVTTLQQPFRFSRKSGIAAVAEAIEHGDVDALHNALEQSECNIVQPQERHAFHHSLVSLGATLVNGQGALLSPHRRGPRGSTALNDVIAAAQGVDNLTNGVPILVTRNDYDTKLFNGDTGILERSEGRAGARFGDRWVPIHQVPTHERAFVLTVHKAQGSEWNHVGLVLPERPSSLFDRRLLYTAVTRAREQLTFLGDRARLTEALLNLRPRTSGLAQQLRMACPLS